MPAGSNKAVIIGGGIGGLATAILLAKQGCQVSLYEKLDSLGGRARQFKAKGFTFDMGPSWYLMPRIFEHFFELIDEDINRHLRLTRLKPGYKVFYENSPPLTIAGDLARDMHTFESIESGAGEALRRYVHRAENTYKTAADSFLYTNFNSYAGFLKPRILKSGPFMALSATKSIDSYVSSYVRDQRLKQILEYPVVFLGASPYKAPALYHLMSYMDFEEGVFYPQGGMYEIISALIKLAKKHGVTLHTGTGVKAINVSQGRANSITLEDDTCLPADLVISNADLHHSETALLAPQYQTYPPKYWQKRTNGPSAMLLYLGIKGKLPQLEHHNLYFTDKWRANFKAIFDDKTWPDPASVYVCKPSATDPSVAPAGHENIFILVPLPARKLNAKQQAGLAARYLRQFKMMINEPDLDKRIVFKRVYGPNDFEADYNSWQGSALGLSHTLRQSAWLRPANKSKKVSNLYYVGGNTIPGIGLPMCLIGAELIVKQLTGDKSNAPLKWLPKDKK